jgi:hypothetical protein
LLSPGWACRYWNPVKDPDTGQAAEIDVLVKESTLVRVCECKGYSNNLVDEPEIKDWLQTRVPRLRKSLLSQDSFKKFPLSFEFWTTGSFTPEAICYLKARKNQFSRYQVTWMDGDGARKYVARTKDSYILKS